MGMSFRLFGLLTMMPTALLLAISFFVLLTIRKIEGQELKVFGYVVAVLLWISAAIIFSSGIYMLATRQHPMASMRSQMMQTKRLMTTQPMIPMRPQMMKQTTTAR